VANKQAVMHYSRHCLTASVSTWQPMANGLALLAHWSVRQKLLYVCSVQFSYVVPYAL